MKLQNLIYALLLGQPIVVKEHGTNTPLWKGTAMDFLDTKGLGKRKVLRLEINRGKLEIYIEGERK